MQVDQRMGWNVQSVGWRYCQFIKYEDESILQIVWRRDQTMGWKVVKDQNSHGYLDGCIEEMGLFRKYIQWK